MNTKNATPIILRTRPAAGCFSAWKLALLARHELPLDAATQGHLQQCADCRAALQEQQVEVAETANVEMPEHLKLLAAMPVIRPRRQMPRVVAGLTLLAASVLAVVFLQPQEAEGPAELAKGGAILVATVLRDGETVAREVPMDEIPAPQLGDRLRLRVNGIAQGSYVTLDTQNDTEWTHLFEGSLPADHWLPTGLRLDGKATTLRMTVCTSGTRDCTETKYKF